MVDRRDVVLITIDSLRADHCGFMGYTEETTPTMDRLAEDGLVFENAIAPAGATRGAATSFLTGVYPFDRSVDDRQRIRGHLRARDTIAEKFARAGYETAAFTANPWTSRYFGFDAGFDRFEDFMDDTVSERFDPEGDAGSIRGAVGRLRDWANGQEMFMTWESFYDDILSWLESTPRPYFLWVFLVDVHMPYLPPPRYRNASGPMLYAANSWLFADGSTWFDGFFDDVVLSAYDDTIRYADAFVERLLGDARGDPLVCVHADHGELFGENGRYGHGHLHEAVIHVPLVVGNAPDESISDPVSLRRMPELLCGLAEGDRPVVAEPYVTARNNDGMRVVRGADWRYECGPSDERVAIRTDTGWEGRAEHPLYGLGRDITDRRVRTDKERTAVVKAVDELRT